VIAVDAAWQPDTQQSVFRGLLTATSYPGRVIDLPAEVAGRTAVAILAALADCRTGVADPDGLLGPRDAAMIEAPQVPVTRADFVLLRGDKPPDNGLSVMIGTIYRPHDSATLVLSVDRLGRGGQTLQLTGCGVKTTTRLLLQGLATRWLAWRRERVATFPIGIDLVLCDKRRVSAVPRTTCLAWAGGVET